MQFVNWLCRVIVAIVSYWIEELFAGEGDKNLPTIWLLDFEAT